ncbi:MAG: LysR family transcriptional regulator [Actinomycetota bacterium]|nr:LysR family transcriptional regulator [Actinomycetota bacterium]
MAPFDTLPPLNQLRVFEAAARLLSFTRAAEELHLSQPAVSQQIKALERHAGRPLFVRRHQSLDLTEAGIAYLPVVQQALDALATRTQAVFGRRDELHLTVQVNLSFAIYWLTPRLSDFIGQHPDLVIDLVTIIHDPERTAPAADVEIRFAREVAGGTLLRRTHAFPVCSPAMAGEADWRTDTLFDCSAMSIGWRHWLRSQNQALPASQRVHLASTYAVGLSAAERGAGLSMTLDLFADAALADGRLARPFEHACPVDDSYWLVEQPERHRSEAARAFAAWFLEQ